MTFHGPLVEPTGVSRQGWEEAHRKKAELQMINAVRRSHELDPKGNVVVTFHSSNGLPEPETKIINDKGEKELKEFWIVNEANGNFQNVAPEVNYLAKETKFEPKDILKKRNEDNWFKALQQVNFHTHQGAQIIEHALEPVTNLPEEQKKLLEKQEILKAYGKPGEAQETIKELGPFGQVLEKKMTEMTHGDIYLRESYGEFQNLFNLAYKNTEEKSEDRKKLDAFRDEIAPKLEQLKKDPSKVADLANEMIKGINILRTINPPETEKQLREWAIDKASTTFANVAFDAYKEFKNSAPIISVENPPVGMGLSRADDLREIVEESRKKFVEQAKKSGVSESNAKAQAEKLIGVTWDVGHINMLRGQGYGEKHVIKETEKIAPYVKHVHLSDNFGLEHTELPMGMGNVPTKQMLELIDKYNKRAKKIAETGTWFEPFKFTPVKQTLSAFGSPLYEGRGPYWNQVADLSAGYFVGQGMINPPIHHSLFGAGFSNLPVELGGQMAGRSRVSGAPIE